VSAWKSAFAPAEDRVLNVTNLSKVYPTPRGPLTILSGVSVSLSRGDAASIMGPSGSGKSTLLYIVGALEPPTSGRVTLDGTDPFTLGERQAAAFRNRHIGFVFQDHALLPQLSVLENVLVPTLVEGTTSDEAGRARTLLDQVGLNDRLDHRPAELSGGEKQRVSLARALVRRPVLLLCDEPTGNLDRSAAAGVASLLLDLQGRQETILIVVTHSAALAERFAIRYEMRDGGLAAISPQSTVVGR
jgi:lipoprotein-releasing system ATP-binding protein